MREAVVVDAVRTPMGRSKGGMFRNVRAEVLSAEVMNALLRRNPELDPKEIEDVVWGCVQQTLEQAFNVARFAQLLTPIPKEVGAQTVNRLCGSSMTALHGAVASILAGYGDVFLVGGVEHMGHLPMTHGLDFSPISTKRNAKAAGAMGLTAEYLARIHGISRQQQDEFALRSHQRAHQATVSGAFKDEIVPGRGPRREGGAQALRLRRGDPPRHDARGALRAEARLRPEERNDHGRQRLGRLRRRRGDARDVGREGEGARQEADGLASISMSAVGVDPSIMGYGPVPAVKKALERVKMKTSDVDLLRAQRGLRGAVAAGAQGPRAARRHGREGQPERRVRSRSATRSAARAPASSRRCSTR